MSSPIGPLPFIVIGPLQLPTYFVVMSVALLLIVFWIQKRSLQKQYSGTTAFDLFFIVTVCGFLGARLVHIFWEEPSFYLSHPAHAFEFWNGGFVFYGGLLGGLAAGWLALRLKQQSFMAWLDFFTPLVSFGYVIGRMACFLTGCCYGKVCSLPWAYQGRHPTQIYSVLLELLLLLALLQLEKRKWYVQHTGSVFMTWLSIHSLSRFIIEYFRDDDRGATLFYLSFSSWLSLLFFTVALYSLRHMRVSK